MENKDNGTDLTIAYQKGRADADAERRAMISSPEMREKIARKLCECDGFNYDSLDKNRVRLFGQTKVRKDYLTRADQIIKLISGESNEPNWRT